ncbi:zinc-dependent alcohol dehydrogenase family protein [Pseudomonas aeruginosa]|uniref:Putative alcohol dehydrogenase n=1 Tax=Pseudomonas aeruginosa TaxID=287 RepID=Q8GPX3_PSEAI|nr:zinc-dependent alcohol dehydrogenase family protein [Pseudomonas aeruginosa]AAN62251.1 putative alcohol dehydrogenase [Pseudomonas aeruginosa]EWH28583.1 alcohol dehydrogenase [Pseudomonas aeruginosa SG17M]KSR73893.1 alcohol dehydrogenase [Pseudomonas aeruginosa]RPU87619.1 alcohol dehydrogenase [Pseudomonas aeruginosa]UFK74871.1 zinc-dependent alcohol dehydrogenase family protein [Pseudomonas aeruginosa SG17M]
MRAAVYESFQGKITVQTMPDPEPSEFGAVIEVKASGICRSDWHGWVGHDTDIVLPHVPGHEFAGVVAAVGRGVTKWKVGDRVTMPFMGVCGSCGECSSGNEQMCDHQFQPGFKHWGSFAQYVAIDMADRNLVALPEAVAFSTAAGLGCRFATSFRAMAFQARIEPGQWVAVHGCGGVGLSAIMIAEALGANTIAIDIADDKLELARALGAARTINARQVDNVASAIADLTGGGAHVSVDALGSVVTCRNSIESLRKRGKHLQVGLLAGDQALPAIPMGRVVLKELQLLGSYGLQPHKYGDMLAMIEAGKLKPEKLIGRTVTLEEATTILPKMDSFQERGVAIIDRF